MTMFMKLYNGPVQPPQCHKFPLYRALLRSFFVSHLTFNFLPGDMQAPSLCLVLPSLHYAQGKLMRIPLRRTVVLLEGCVFLNNPSG